MKTTFYIATIIVGVAIIVLLIWNIILYNRKINKKSKSDERYYEMKYQQQFYIAIFTTLIAVLSFFGYDKYSEIEHTIKNDVAKQTDSIVSKSKYDFDTKLHEIEAVQAQIKFQYENLKETNNSLRENSNQTNERFYELLNQFISLKKELVESEIELESQLKNIENTNGNIESLKKDIDGFKKIDFLNQVYLVTNQHFKGSLLNMTDTIYFKDLKTYNNKLLPTFNSPPSLILSRTSPADISLTRITKEYYVVDIPMYTAYTPEDEKPENWTYDLLIIYKELK